MTRLWHGSSITRRLPGDPHDRLAAEGHDVDVWEGDLPPSDEELRARAQGAEGLITLLTERVDGDLLDALPGLKVVPNYAVGSDNIDLDAAEARGVAVGVTPDVLTEATADLALALMLTVARGIVPAAADVHAGRWRTWEPQGWIGRDVHGASLLVVGAGRIGQAVAKRGAGFDMDVAVADIGDDLMAMLPTADFVSLHVPLTESTEGLIGAEQLAAMKPTAILVNTARGPVIDQRRAGAGAARRRDRRRRARRHRPRAAAGRRPAAAGAEPARRPAHRLAPPRGARQAMTDLRRAQPARRDRRRARPLPRAADAVRVAVVDVGTNSTRLLVADVAGRRADGARAPLDGDPPRRRASTRAAASATSRSPARPRRRSTATGTAIEALGADARGRGAHERGARRRQRRGLHRARSRDATASRRARSPATRRRALTFRGATSRARRGATELVVIDIGGGSTELVTGHGPDVDFHVSMQAGVVRHRRAPPARRPARPPS